MLLEFLARLMSFDIIWIVTFVMGNLHWLFAIGATVYIFYDKKRFLLPFIFTVGLMWAALDFSNVSGWTFTVSVFLAVYYISRIALIVFASEIKGLKDMLPVVFTLHFLTIFAIFNIFFA
jgi:hypothetical protein